MWNPGEQLAWTEHDGPGRPPSSANRALWLVLAAVLAIVFTGMVFTDVLCPEHRAWVQALGGIALFGTATSVVALVRGWASAPLITLASAANGVAIGLIDAAHDPARGRLVALAFGLAVAGALALYTRQLLLARWERRVLAASPHTPLPRFDAPVPPPAADGDTTADGRVTVAADEVTAPR
jgi:hypothetical protein